MARYCLSKIVHARTQYTKTNFYPRLRQKILRSEFGKATEAGGASGETGARWI